MKKAFLKLSILLAAVGFVGCDDSSSKSTQTSASNGSTSEILKSNYVRGYEPIFITPDSAQSTSASPSYADDVRFVLDESAAIYAKDDKAKQIGKIYEGSQLKLVQTSGEYSLVSLSGEVSADKSTIVYKVDGDESLLPFALIDDGGAEPSMEFWIRSASLTNSPQVAWEEIELIYYDTCTSCHSAHNPKEHPMDEWDAYLSAMQLNAKISDEQKDRILRFMQAHASDGMIK